MEEENSSKVCLNEETEQIDSHKEIADDISDEDDDTRQEHAKPKSNLFISSLVANYGSEDEGKYRQISKNFLLLINEICCLFFMEIFQNLYVYARACAYAWMYAHTCECLS